MSTLAGPTFPLGQLVATPNALDHITHEDIMAALQRHVAGDWGDLTRRIGAFSDTRVIVP